MICGAALVAEILLNFLQLFDDDAAQNLFGARISRYSAMRRWISASSSRIFCCSMPVRRWSCSSMMACACRSVKRGPRGSRIDHLGVGGGFGGRDEIHQRFARFARSLGGADQGDHCVQIVQRVLEAEQDVLAVAGFAQQEVGAPADDFDAMLDEALEHVDQAQLARLAVDDGQHDDAEVDLQLRVLIKVVEHDFGLLAALQLEHDAHAVAVALVADFGDAFELLFVHQAGGVFDQAGFVDLIRDLGDDDGSRSLPIFSVAALARI